MPQTPTPNMGLVQPTEGGDTDVWDTLLSTLFTRLDLHDHSTGLGVKVKPSGFDWNADMAAASGGTPFAVTGVKAVDFAAVAASTITSYAGAFFVNSDDANNLYFRTVAGVNVKVTDGSTLNVSASGGIAGDYAAISAQVAYEDANDRYTLKQESSAGVRQWAKLSSGDLDLYEYIAAGSVTNITNRVRLQSPSALAASYALTMPAALPVSTQIVQLTSAGVLAASNALSQPVAMTSTLAVTGLITATAGATVGANAHVTVSGTGRFKHGDRTITVPFFAGKVTSGTPTYSAAGNVTGINNTVIPLPLPAGARIRQVVFTFNRGGAGAVQFDVSRRTGDGAGANFVNISTSTASSGTGFTTATHAAIDHTVLAGWAYWIIGSSNDAANVLAFADITYDMP